MKLKEFKELYEAKKGPNDWLSVFYETRAAGKTRREEVDGSALWTDTKNEARNEKARLLLEADIIESHIYKTEGQYFGFTGRGSKYTCFEFSAKIDADQAQIALGIHPALKAKAKPEKATAIETKRRTKRKKTETKGKKRFCL